GVRSARGPSLRTRPESDTQAVESESSGEEGPFVVIASRIVVQSPINCQEDTAGYLVFLFDKRAKAGVKGLPGLPQSRPVAVPFRSGSRGGAATTYAGCCASPAAELLEEPVEGQLELLGSLVGTRGDLPPDLLDSFLANLGQLADPIEHLSQ